MSLIPFSLLNDREQTQGHGRPLLGLPWPRSSACVRPSSAQALLLSSLNRRGSAGEEKSGCVLKNKDERARLQSGYSEQRA